MSTAYVSMPIVGLLARPGAWPNQTTHSPPARLTRPHKRLSKTPLSGQLNAPLLPQTDSNGRIPASPSTPSVGAATFVILKSASLAAHLPLPGPAAPELFAICPGLSPSYGVIRTCYHHPSYDSSDRCLIRVGLVFRHFAPFAPLLQSHPLASVTMPEPGRSVGDVAGPDSTPAANAALHGHHRKRKERSGRPKQRKSRRRSDHRCTRHHPGASSSASRGLSKHVRLAFRGEDILGTSGFVVWAHLEVSYGEKGQREVSRRSSCFRLTVPE